jgi:TPR repeat protein
VPYKRPQKANEQNATPPPALQDEDEDVTDVGGFGDFGGFDSPVKAQDNIDWTITSCDLEKLKLEILPCYWEHLLDSVNSIVRVTQRLYILQDWNHKGHLVV